jgi:hypothetical protein
MNINFADLLMQSSQYKEYTEATKKERNERAHNTKSVNKKKVIIIMSFHRKLKDKITRFLLE